MGFAWLRCGAFAQHWWLPSVSFWRRLHFMLHDCMNVVQALLRIFLVQVGHPGRHLYMYLLSKLLNYKIFDHIQTQCFYQTCDRFHSKLNDVPCSFCLATFQDPIYPGPLCREFLTSTCGLASDFCCFVLHFDFVHWAANEVWPVVFTRAATNQKSPSLILFAARLNTTRMKSTSER